MWHLFQKNFLFLGFSCCEKAANIFPVGFKRNWPHTWSVVELFTFGHFLLNLESEIFCCLCDGSQSPDANIGCNDVSQSKSHKSFVLVHDHLNISEIGTYGKWIHWNSTGWTSQNSKREDRLRNRLIEVYPVVLEEEEGLKKGEDHVHNGYEHVQWSITLHPILIFKDLGDSETIQNHSPCTETWMRKQRSNYWKSVSQPRSNYNLKISFKPSCFQGRRYLCLCRYWDIDV